MKCWRTYLVLYAAVSGLCSHAAAPVHQPSTTQPREEEVVEESNDEDTRSNPELEAGIAGNVNTATLKRYPFLNAALNKVLLNGADVGALVAKFADAAAGRGMVSVVQIGDSHIQADGNTGRTRMLLQKEFGDAGRGLLIPFRVAGTNQPLDYRITTTAPVTTSKLMRMPWPTDMGFTGIAVHPEVSRSQWTLSVDRAFNQLDIFGDGNFEVQSIKAPSGRNVEFEATRTSWGVKLKLNQSVSGATVDIASAGTDFTLYGMSVSTADAAGVQYHAIGNNGATYSTYSLTGNFGRDLSALNPDLVVVSLGTNEAFGNMSDAVFYAQIDRLVSDIRRHNPQATVLLTTPSECQRSVVSRRRSGTRRRRRWTTTRSYQVNANVARMRNTILRYASDKGLPVYDFYEVAGGKGASAHWLQNKLLSSDRIHRTWSGYYVEGELWNQALRSMLTEAMQTRKARAAQPTLRPPKVKADNMAQKGKKTHYSTKSKKR